MSDTVTSTPLPRSEAEVVARMREAKKRDPLGFEWTEYLAAPLSVDALLQSGVLSADATRERIEEAQRDTQSDTVETLTARAKDYLSFWLEKIEGERGISVHRATAHYSAWKWLLGHPDADTFPGSINGGDGGWYQRDAYDYIREQVESGEWDRLTAEALAAR